MTTGHIDVDFDTNTLDVAVGGPDVDLSIAGPSVDLGVPGLVGPRGPSRLFVVFGNADVVPPPGAGQIPFYPRIEGFVIRVTAAVSDQTSGATIVDVNISGSSIYGDPAERPTLDQVGQHFDDANTIAFAHFTDTDFFTVDRDSVGVGAKNLIVTVEYESI